MAVILIIAVIASGIATYAALTETPPLGNDPDTVIWLLNIDLILLLMIIGFIARRIVALWSGKKRGLAGSHLHVRLVYIFSIIAAVPAIIMTIFSAYFFHFGVQTWFSERVRTAVNESQAVAEAYLEEHTQVIRADTLAMANDLNRQADLFMFNEQALQRILQTQSVLRNLSEVIIFDKQGRIYARSGLTFSLEFEEIPNYALERADDGDVVILAGGNEDRVRALLKLENYVGRYLFVGRMIDPKVLSHLASTKVASEDYSLMEERYSNLQVAVTMIFIVIGLLLMVCAIWISLLIARQMVAPIGTLINAADRVRAGDLSVRVEEQMKVQEFEYLAHSFNRMTRQIQEQQNELIEANRQLDRRRHFTETVLKGVSSGVLGVDSEGAINVANSTAVELLGLKGEIIHGAKISEILPQLNDLMEKAYKKAESITQGEITLVRPDKTRRNFFVRIAIETIAEKEIGAIITFDDITDLQSAQRKAAWADVARRIAHEIKNPLTPIQLSAERLKRKYMPQIENDAKTFEECTDTIVRHVEDIGHMVNEFSAFARMPEPKLKRADVIKEINQALILHRQAHSTISYEIHEMGHMPKNVLLDTQQFRQVIGNLVQNSVESIEARIEQQGGDEGRVDIHLGSKGNDQIFIAIIDNGIGFPEDADPESLTEPYVTHKPKGTGLGLAIVKKIMEDHNGSLIVSEQEWLRDMGVVENVGGAVMVLTLPVEDALDETIGI
ncbi:MAG: PAS domain-containing sensor histidine kinase [Micavibrio sp.]|nr:PAS domain-containing sensor histidine kinase [Micavibrio sp.]